MFLEFSYRSESKLIDFDEAEIADERVLITKLLTEFTIERLPGRRLQLITPAGAMIPPLRFPEIVEQFKNCGCWSLKIVFVDSTDTSSEIALRLKQFIVDHDGDHALFAEEQDRGLCLNSQNVVFNLVYKFITVNYTVNVGRVIAERVCSAAIELFKSLTVTNSSIGGIDLLYNHAARKGAIYQKLRYGKAKNGAKGSAVLPAKRPRLDNAPDNDIDGDGEEGDSLEEAIDDESIESDALLESANSLISFINSCRLPRDISKIEKKFEETIELRRKMVLKLDDYQQLFNLYLVFPNLVLIDFRLRFSTINAQALKQLWPNLQKNVVSSFGNRRIGDEFRIYRKNAQINTLMKLLTLLPTHRKSFKTGLHSLMSISENVNADPVDLIKTPKPFPNIIAIQSSSDSNHCKFYIQVKGQLMSIQPGADFVDVLDLYYKVHKIFGLQFADEFRQLMIFFDHYVYRDIDDDIVPSTATVQMANQLID